MNGRHEWLTRFASGEKKGNTYIPYLFSLIIFIWGINRLNFYGNTRKSLSDRALVGRKPLEEPADMSRHILLTGLKENRDVQQQPYRWWRHRSQSSYMANRCRWHFIEGLFHDEKVGGFASFVRSKALLLYWLNLRGGIGSSFDMPWRITSVGREGNAFK